ncbi:tyrosine-type recombinase/integrase [Natronorubrum texcoconense]|uniref:Site-specific recombinase XerD n=1 Tax=Natronorubrum texcoconense TaxID=1095776 RepID=A0A1G9H903_9EURY|nr:tyrosine-type recombinase/integrase [Natronorubrum texcoconense]SDL09325.1 Site-specific recombinase XerD [Natronorubrum texcoconense]
MTRGHNPEGMTLETAVAEFVAERDGNYASNLEYCLKKWVEWCQKRDCKTVNDVSTLTMRNYASYLKRRSDAEEGIAATTARTYYNYVSALLSWAVEVEQLAENPAEKRRAKKPLPKATTNSGDQQFWSPEQRRAITEYVDERAREAIAVDGTDAFEAVRNRALVAMLAYSGVRGAEVLADARDDRRNGLRWGDVDLENGVITVLGKNQKREPTPIPDQVVTPLERLETLLGSPADNWPVFPSRHPPSLYAAIDDTDHDKPDGNSWGYILETGIEPPSISTSGTRTLLKRLSDEADVPGLEDDDYLTLHGARRGVGEKLYRERGAVAAQRTLRHADPKTTSQMYSHIEASEMAEDNTEVFDGE